MIRKPISLSEGQALAFRSRRHHLLGPGATTPQLAVRAVVGTQAQVVAPALWSLAMRCAAPPTAADLGAILETSPDLVRTWGQRGTVHIYDARTHWAPAIACFGQRISGGRPGPQPAESVLKAAASRIKDLGRPVTRSDLFDLIPEDFLAFMVERVGPGVPALRAAAGRIIWVLARRGILSAHTVVDGEQSYVLRSTRFPGLEWTEPSEEEAGLALTRDYLRANAPATAQDVAHFLGSRVSEARQLLALFEGELAPVVSGDRPGLLALARDRDELEKKPPRSWPPRLLPKFDTLLMCHKDKSWTVPNEDDRPHIWAKAAQVNATVLYRGRLVATWKFKALKKKVQIEIAPLSGWQDGLERSLSVEAGAFALHLGRTEAEVHVASSQPGLSG